MYIYICLTYAMRINRALYMGGNDIYYDDHTTYCSELEDWLQGSYLAQHNLG